MNDYTDITEAYKESCEQAEKIIKVLKKQLQCDDVIIKELNKK